MEQNGETIQLLQRLLHLHKEIQGISFYGEQGMCCTSRKAMSVHPVNMCFPIIIIPLECTVLPLPEFSMEISHRI